MANILSLLVVTSALLLTAIGIGLWALLRQQQTARRTTSRCEHAIRTAALIWRRKMKSDEYRAHARECLSATAAVAPGAAPGRTSTGRTMARYVLAAALALAALDGVRAQLCPEPGCDVSIG